MFSFKQATLLQTKKQVVIALRFVILLSMTVMACWGQKIAVIPAPVYLALLAFLINTLLVYLKYFNLLDQTKTLALGFIIDIIAMTFLVYYSGGPEIHRFYLVFLITILITATAHTLIAAFVTSFIVSIIYGIITLQYQGGETTILLSFAFLSKIAFLFTISTFIGFLSEEVERERREKEEVKAELLKKERLALVGQLSSGLAHDFFNILGGLKKLIDFSLQQNDSPAEQKKVMELASSGLDRSLTIVQNLLTFSRKPTPRLTATEIDKIMNEALMLVKNDFDQDKVKIIKEFEPLPAIQADPGQLHQVFLNLLLNARQSMTTQGGEVRIRLTPVKDDIEIEVADTGCGIDLKIKDKIFEPFVSSKTTPKKGGGGGIGLGLYVSQEIIHAHNGSINIDSEPDRGTRVIIKLPIRN